jgi:hypothetical protein
MLQVIPYFDIPYNSNEIGLVRVSRLDLGSDFHCSPQDIHSKCIILSDGVKVGSADEPDKSMLDPMPLEVKRLLKSSKFTNTSIQQAYKVAFPDAIPTWTIHSLLLPGRDC